MGMQMSQMLPRNAHSKRNKIRRQEKAGSTMTWESLAILTITAVVVAIFILVVGTLVSTMLDAQNKRKIEQWNAGLTPKGWHMKDDK